MPPLAPNARRRPDVIRLGFTAPLAAGGRALLEHVSPHASPPVATTRPPQSRHRLAQRARRTSPAPWSARPDLTPPADAYVPTSAALTVGPGPRLVPRPSVCTLVRSRRGARRHARGLARARRGRVRLRAACNATVPLRASRLGRVGVALAARCVWRSGVNNRNATPAPTPAPAGDPRAPCAPSPLHVSTDGRSATLVHRHGTRGGECQWSHVCSMHDDGSRSPSIRHGCPGRAVCRAGGAPGCRCRGGAGASGGARMGGREPADAGR